MDNCFLWLSCNLKCGCSVVWVFWICCTYTFLCWGMTQHSLPFSSSKVWETFLIRYTIGPHLTEMPHLCVKSSTASFYTGLNHWNSLLYCLVAGGCFKLSDQSHLLTNMWNRNYMLWENFLIESYHSKENLHVHNW